MIDTQEYLKSLEVIQDALSKSKEYLRMLRLEQSLCDKEVADIQHAIEFSNCNASQGYSLYKDLQITLQRRRKVKDEIEVVRDMIRYSDRGVSLKVHSSESTKGLQNQINRLSRQQYTPRVRTDLKAYYNK